MKKNYFLLTILFALLCIGQVWGNEAPSNSLKSSRSWTGSHATFTLSGDNGNGTNDCVGVKGGQDIYVNWTVDEGCTINVTAIRMKVGHSRMVHGGWTCEISINDEYKWGVGTNADFRQTADGYNLHNDDNFKLSFSTNADLYWVTITYTITPTGKPTAVEVAEAVIDVTVNEADKQTVDLSQFFNMPAGVPSDFAFGYEVSGGVVEGDNFYATAAGEYTVKARIAAKENCHEASELSEGEATITVNRINQTLSWVDEEAIETDIVIEDTKTIAAVSTSGRAVSYVSSNEAVLTVDETGKLTTIAVGEASIIVTCGQDDQYNAAEPIQKTFQVIRKTPVFSPVDFVTEDSCAVRKNEAATIELTNVSDGLEGDFTAVPSNDKISVSREGNVLTIHALEVGEATLTLSQKQTDVLAEFSKTYKVEVLRLTNSILVNGVADFVMEIQTEGNLPIAFASENTDEAAPEFVVEQISGEEIATYEEGFIVSNYHLGTAVLKVSQAQSDNYEAAEATFTVSVIKAEEAICYVLEDDELQAWETVGRTKEYHVDGPAAKLKFQARRDVMAWLFSTNGDFFAEYSTTEDDDEWNRLEPYMDLPNEGVWYTCEYDIPVNTKRVRMRTQTGAQGYRKIQNVRVTRKTYLRPEDVVLNLLPDQAGEGVLTVDYSLADGNELKIVSDNDLFTLDQTTIDYENCTSGKVEIPVHFAAKAELGTYTTNLTIYNSFYNATVKLVAKVRITPEITWNISELTYDDRQENAASVSPNVALKYEVIDGDAITLDGDVLVAANAGKATVKAYTEESELYNAAEETLEITVNQLAIEIADPEETIYLDEGDALTNDLLAALTQALEKLLGWIEGIFTWNTTQTEAVAGDVEYEVTFTPDNTNLAPAPAKVRVNVKGAATGCDNLEAGSKSVKLLINGQVYIYRDGRLYNLQGLRVE